MLCPQCFVEIDEPKYVPPIGPSELGSLAGSYFAHISEHRSQYLDIKEDPAPLSNELLFLSTINRAQPDYIRTVIGVNGDYLLLRAKGWQIRSLILRISKAMRELDTATYTLFNQVMS